MSMFTCKNIVIVLSLVLLIYMAVGYISGEYFSSREEMIILWILILFIVLSRKREAWGTCTLYMIFSIIMIPCILYHRYNVAKIISGLENLELSNSYGKILSDSYAGYFPLLDYYHLILFTIKAIFFCVCYVYLSRDAISRE